MSHHKWILKKLPYTSPFLFVDRLEEVTDDGVVGYYQFTKDSFFYKGHFKNYPVTPGVILTECCAQIGLVCLGIHLLHQQWGEFPEDKIKLALSSSDMEYFLPVYPDDDVRVKSIKSYFRFNKLKCIVKMYNAENEVVCSGVLAGMLKIDQ